MKKAFFILTVLTLSLFVGGFLVLRATVFDQAALAGPAGVSTEIAAAIPSQETSPGNTAPSSGENNNPHGTKAYSSLTSEQQKKADSELNDLKLAISEFLRSEVEMGLMTRGFADEIQNQLFRLLTVNRSPVSGTPQQNPGSNI